MSPSALERLAVIVGERLERRRPWHTRSRVLGLVALLALRARLREHNQHDVALPPPAPGPDEPPNPAPPPRRSRTSDGRFTVRERPNEGAAGAAFGRNLTPAAAPSPALLDPSPREVSRRLLARRGPMTPATTLNLLAAAWLQFQVHDWVSHGANDAEAPPIAIPLEADDDWHAPTRPANGGMGMQIRPTRPSGHPPAPGGPPAFRNTETAWWDGSQLYGSTARREQMVREHVGGRLRVDPDGRLPLDPRTGFDVAGVTGNWWLGLSLLHTLFAREHNAICASLVRAYPSWDDQRLYEVARLVNAAVMAKIHTVEWTTAILPHAVTRAALRGNWFGVLGPAWSRRLRRLTRSDLLIGIPGSRRDDHGVPYSLTEEFVAVYRMHPLMPDELAICALGGHEVSERRALPQLAGPGARAALTTHPLEDLLWSFGIAHPGALTLHNYPDWLRTLVRSRTDTADGREQRIDLAAVDIVRDRERGVPRYNDFRRGLRMPAAATFPQLTGGDAALAAELEDLYGHPDRVDLMVGLYAEPLIPGFGFSETAFRIFVLMASRRLKADPFFTDDYRPEVYSPEGLAWIAAADMHGVLVRHFPALAPHLPAGANPFAPWGAPVPDAPPPGRGRGRERAYSSAA